MYVNRSTSMGDLIDVLVNTNMKITQVADPTVADRPRTEPSTLFRCSAVCFYRFQQLVGICKLGPTSCSIHHVTDQINAFARIRSAGKMPNDIHRLS